MLVTIDIARSKEWVQSQRLARGENVPEYIKCEVEPAQLSEQSRKLLLVMGFGEYPGAVTQFGFNRDYEFRYSANWGHVKPVVDSDSPTCEEINRAIEHCIEEVAAKKDKELARRAAHEASQAAAAEARAREEAERERARELLSSELQQLREAALQAAADRKKLAYLLCYIPQDALRGAIKRWADEEVDTKADDLRNEVENASPYIVFKDEDDDECEDAD